MHKRLSRGNGKQHFPFPRDVFCRVEKRFSFIYILSMSESSNNEIVIYTDGGCSGNPGPGGWANVILADGTENPHSGGEHGPASSPPGKPPGYASTAFGSDPPPEKGIPAS